MIFSTKEMSYGQFGAVSYRIEMDLSNSQRPMQRHIWTLDSGEVRAENWIYAGQRTEVDLLSRGYSKAA